MVIMIGLIAIRIAPNNKVIILLATIITPRMTILLLLLTLLSHLCLGIYNYIPEKNNVMLFRL
jgi:hypothetical protein